MKIAFAGHARLSSGEPPQQTLANQCRQFAFMDPKSAFPPQHPQRPKETTEEQEMEQQAWRNPECFSAPEASPENFLPDDNLLFGGSSMHSDLVFSRQSANDFLPPHVDEKLCVPEGMPKGVQVSRLASFGALSSCTEYSEEELRLAEVNPVTFPVFGGSHQPKQTPDLGAPWPSTPEQSLDVGYSAPPYGNQFQSLSRLPDDAEMTSDGEFSHPAVYASECHGGGASSPGTSSMDVHRSSNSSEETLCSPVRLMCSYGGKIMARPGDGKLRYVGGETHIVAADRDTGYSKFMSKMANLYNVPLVLKYQLPDEDLDALVSVSSDDDLQNMMEEYDKIESSGGVSRLRLFFFTSPAEYETSQLGLQTEPDDRCTDSEQRYIDAINGVAERINDTQVEDDTSGFRQMDGLDFVLPHHDAPSAAVIWSGPQVNTFSGIPSAPSSCPSSPPVALRQAAHLKPPGMGDVSVQILNERLNKVSLHPRGYEGSTQEVDQDGSGGFLSPSHIDHQYRMTVESPRRTHHDIPESRGEGWRIAESGMHRVDSQTMMRQSEQHIDRGTAADPWHDVHQPSEMLLPQGELPRFLLQQHKHIPQHPTPPAWQSQMDGNLGRVDKMQHISDVHMQPQTFHQPHQAVQQHHQAAHLRPHQTMAGHDGISWNSDHQAIPSFLQGSMQSHPQIPLGLGPAPPYQMGSNPGSPRVAVHDYQGRCSCPQQHSQVHRGISVSLSDQSYNRRPHFMDQPARKHGLPNSSRFCDNPNHSGEPLMFLQQPSHFIGPEAEQQEGSPWQHFQERNNAQCHLAECQLRNRTSQFCDPSIFAEPFLPSHDLLEPNKTRFHCTSCYDHRRQQHVEKAAVHPVFTDVQDQTGDWVMPQRTLEVEDGRISTAGRALGKIPIHKEEEWRGEFEVEKQLDGELDSYYNRGQGELKRSLAIPGGGVHGRFPVHVVPASRPVVSEDLQVSQPLSVVAYGEPEWHSKLPISKASTALGDSWSTSALEPRVRPDLLPSVHSRAPHRRMEEAVNEISIGTSAPMADGTNCLEKNPVSISMFTGMNGQGHDFNTTESYRRDDVCRPTIAGRVRGEAATEVLPSPAAMYELSEAGCDGGWPSAANKRTHLLSHDPTHIDSSALPHAAVPASHMWKAFPPGTLSMTTLEGTLNTSAFPIYDQSPLSSINTTDFSFEPREASLAPGGANVDREGYPPCIPGIGLLADGMVSSVLDSCTNKGACEDRRDADQEANNMNSNNIQKSETEEGAGTRSVESNPLLPSSTALLKGLSIKEADTVTDWVGVSVEKEQLTGVVPAVQTDLTNEIAYEEKHVQAGSVCTKEPKGPACSEAELEAIARGVQIIKNEDVEDLKELGSGTFGTVFHGKWRGSDVAIKRIKASCFTGQPSEQERLISDFWKEALTLGQLHHPNIVAFYGVVPDGPGGTLATVTEYMVNGSLKQVLHKKDRTIDRKKRLLIAMDAAFGMEYLHSKNIVHFDLKCENLLVNMKDAHRPICKVGDFGLSKVKHKTLVSGGVRGTLPWMAPELLSGNNSMVTEKIDVFSFGIVMWELLTGEEPYANMHCGAIIGGIVNNTLRPPIPSWCDPGWRNLMGRCWAGDPADRPSFSEVARELRAISVK